VPLTFVADRIVHLDPTDSCWVVLKSFAFDDALTDEHLLGALLDEDQYHDQYIGQPVADQHHHSMHGPYLLDHISVSSFVRIDADAARALISAWADDPEPSEPATHLRLATEVYPILGSGDLYQLPALGPQAFYDHRVVGRSGFHEFVVIDRQSSLLTLVVASDD
jgi:hypothetical protein